MQPSVSAGSSHLVFLRSYINNTKGPQLVKPPAPEPVVCGQARIQALSLPIKKPATRNREQMYKKVKEGRLGK